MARRFSTRLAAAYSLLSCLASTIAASAPIYSANIPSLIARDDLTCESSTFTKCGGNFPGNFCCDQASTCQSINNGKTALCCPPGNDCTLIGPIDCDIQQQNATSHPGSQLFTTDFTSTLEKCGNSCCPSGMTCDGGTQCVLQRSASSSSSSSPSSSAKPSSSAAAASSAARTTSSDSPPTETGTPASETSAIKGAAVTASRCNQFPTAGVLVGFFSGLAAGIIITILCICCIGRTRNSHDSKRDSGDLSSVQASVSDPIYNPDAQNSYRSDFLRAGAGAGPIAKNAHRVSRASTKVRSMFRTPTMRSKASPSLRSMPKTPTMNMRKEPSMESIRIYSPPNIDRATQNTTFAEMMREVGLKENGPYLGSPGRVDPRSRRLGEV